MSAPDLPIIEKLLTERFLGTDRHGASIVDDRNPDGPEAAEVIKELYEALDKAERIMSSAREELNRLRAQAKLPPMEPAALNVAVYEAKTALSRARGEEVGNG
jgi:hypothetical protein